MQPVSSTCRSRSTRIRIAAIRQANCRPSMASHERCGRIRFRTSTARRGQFESVADCFTTITRTAIRRTNRPSTAALAAAAAREPPSWKRGSASRRSANRHIRTFRSGCRRPSTLHFPSSPPPSTRHGYVNLTVDPATGELSAYPAVSAIQPLNERAKTFCFATCSVSTSRCSKTSADIADCCRTVRTTPQGIALQAPGAGGETEYHDLTAGGGLYGTPTFPASDANVFNLMGRRPQFVDLGYGADAGQLHHADWRQRRSSRHRQCADVVELSFPGDCPRRHSRRTSLSTASRTPTARAMQPSPGGLDAAPFSITWPPATPIPAASVLPAAISACSAAPTARSVHPFGVPLDCKFWIDGSVNDSSKQSDVYFGPDGKPGIAGKRLDDSGSPVYPGGSADDGPLETPDGCPDAGEYFADRSDDLVIDDTFNIGATPIGSNTVFWNRPGIRGPDFAQGERGKFDDGYAPPISPPIHCQSRAMFLGGNHIRRAQPPKLTSSANSSRGIGRQSVRRRSVQTFGTGGGERFDRCEQVPSVQPVQPQPAKHLRLVVGFGRSRLPIHRCDGAGRPAYGAARLQVEPGPAGADVRGDAGWRASGGDREKLHSRTRLPPRAVPAAGEGGAGEDPRARTANRHRPRRHDSALLHQWNGLTNRGSSRASACGRRLKRNTEARRRTGHAPVWRRVSDVCSQTRTTVRATRRRVADRSGSVGPVCGGRRLLRHP